MELHLTRCVLIVNLNASCIVSVFQRQNNKQTSINIVREDRGRVGMHYSPRPQMCGVYGTNNVNTCLNLGN